MRPIVFHFGVRLRVQHVGAVPFHFQSTVPSPIDLRIVGALAPARGRVFIGHVILMALRGALLPIGGAMVLAYRPEIWTPLTAAAGHDCRAAVTITQAAADAAETATELAIVSAAAFRAGEALCAIGTIPIRHGRPLDSWNGEVFQAGAGLDSGISETFKQMAPVDAWNGEVFQAGAGLDSGISETFRQMAPVDAWCRKALRAAVALDIVQRGTTGDGAGVGRGMTTGFRNGALLLALSVPFQSVMPPVIPPGTAPELIFHFGWQVRPTLTFHFPSVRRRVLYIPVREGYIVTPDCELIRLPEGVDIPAESFTVAVDIGLSLHGLSAAVSNRAGFERLSAAPGVQVELRAQGYAWRFIVNRLSGSWGFGAEAYTLEAMSLARILGRGRAVPKSYLETQAKTLIQLAERELQFSGWTLDWTAADWLIPGGTWAYDRLTPLEALQSLADAAGGYVHADPVAQILHVKPRYGVLPWQLPDVAPDVVLPGDPVEVLSFEADPKEDYTSVYVHGTSQGRKSAQVTIAGSGGLVAPDEPQTNALLTHYDGLRAFGARYLGDHQSITRWRLTLPLQPITGDVPLLDIGQVIQFGWEGIAWRGIVESVRVVMSGVELTQQIEVATYG